MEPATLYREEGGRVREGGGLDEDAEDRNVTTLDITYKVWRILSLSLSLSLFLFISLSLSLSLSHTHTHTHTHI